MPIRILRSTDTNPWFNLATEDHIFRDMDPAVDVLFLWRNQPNIVIGRHQNPWAECDLEAMEREGVLLTRRQSGGGAVYQDLGNSCFTFLSGKASYSVDRNFALIIDALARLGVAAEQTGRNDLLVAGRKVSGSAFKLAADRAFHHGTMLLHADLDRLGALLRPDPRKLTAKGVKSVRSRVANLSEWVPGLDHDRFCDAMVAAFREHHGERAPVELLDRSVLETIPSLAEHYAHQSDWAWRYGETPDFAITLKTRFDWGLVDVHLDTARGKVARARVFSDSLRPEMIERVADALVGAPYEGEALATRVRAVGLAREYAAEAAELAGWLAGSVA
ncbi:MAG: lipoate--protein ligase [Candidatus Krumholzibacteriia bacterium]